MSRSLTRRFVHDASAGDAAWEVVFHAERQRRRGKNPSMAYLTERNPRDALEEALKALDFESYAAFQDWLEDSSAASLYKPLETVHRPWPADLVGELEVMQAALVIDEPRNPGRYIRKLSRGKGRVPLTIRVRDAEERSFRLLLSIHADLTPNRRDQVVLHGTARPDGGIKVRTFDGELRALFPGQTVRVQIVPRRERFVLEFL